MARVMKALLARACLPFCLLQVFRFECGQLLYTDIVFLSIWLVFTTVCIQDAADAAQQLRQAESFLVTFFRECCYIGIMLIMYVTVHQMFMERTETRKYLLIDHGFPFMNFRQVFHWVATELFDLLWFLWNYLRALNIRLYKLAAYLMYLGLNAVVLTFILEILFKFFVMELYVVLHDNFQYTFDVNTTDFYPTGYMSAELLNRSLYDKTTFYSERFSCNPNVHRMCTQPIAVHSFSTEKFPLEQKLFHRFIGEDISMVCSYARQREGSASFATSSTVWYFNQKMVANSTRHRIETYYFTTGEWQSVTSILTIKLLKESEFGEYTCTETAKDINQLLTSYGEIWEDHHNYKYTVNVFTLKQIKVKSAIIRRIVGNLITSEHFFWYHTQDDSSDVSVQYTINGRSVGEVCPGFQTRACSVGASLLRTFIRVGADNFAWNGVESFPYLDIGSYLPDLKRGILYFCLCSSGYGVHKVTFLREFHRLPTNLTTHEEILHPFVFIVLPLPTISLFRFFDDSHLYEGIAKLVENETNLDVIEHEIQQHLIFITANEDKVFTMADFLQNIMFISGCILLYMTVVCASTIYYKVFIVVPGRAFVFRHALPETPQLLAIDDKCFDVFLSYAEEDHEVVTGITNFLEETHNLRVCLAGRDIPPNRSIFSMYEENIRKSRKVIVFVSQSYLEEPVCKYLQLEHTILPLVYESAIQGHDLLILKCPNCKLRNSLRWNFSIAVLNWTRDLPLQVLLCNLLTWIKTGRVRN